MRLYSNMNLIFKSFSFVVFFFLAANPALSNQPSDISCNIKYIPEHPTCLDVTVSIKGNSAGKHLLKLPLIVGNLTLKAERGNFSYSMVDDRVFWLYTDPNVDVQSNYLTCSNNAVKDVSFPIVSDNYFSFIMSEILFLPSDPAALANVKVKFENFPEDYSFITNYSTGNQKYEINDTVRRISRSTLSGGKFNIETFYVTNKPIHLVTHGKWKMFKVDELKKHIIELISKQRSFLKDNNFDSFAILLHDDGGLSKQGAVTGTLFENVLRMLIIDSEEKNKYLVYGSLSHELFHAWIGNKIQIPPPQGPLQWFFEGVNDFYGWQLALDSGVISEKDYVNYYNRILAEYLVSPYRNDSNEAISRNFHLNSSANQLAQIRGHIVFMEIFHKLKKQGLSREPVDAALREIIQIYSNTGLLVTQEALNTIFSKHIGDEIWTEAVEVLYNGKPIALSANLLSTKNKLFTVQAMLPDLGFDFKRLLLERRVVSLDTNSNASHAGLKEADEMIDISFNPIKVDGPVFIRIKDSGKSKVIQFVPNKSEKEIQQYRQLPSGYRND